MTVEQIESRVRELQIVPRKIEQRLRHLEGSHEYVKEHNENLSFISFKLSIFKLGIFL